MFTAWSFWPWMIMRRMWQLWDVRANRPITLCTRMHSKDFCDLTWSCLGRESFIIRPDLPWPLLSTDMTLKARGWGGGYWLSCSLGCRVRGEGVGGGYGPVMVSDVFAYRPWSPNPSGMGLWSLFIPEVGPHTMANYPTNAFIPTSHHQWYFSLINKIWKVQ